MPFASNGLSAVLHGASDDVAVGQGVTLSADGNTVVPATTANLAASPSGLVLGIAVTAASARQSAEIIPAGPLYPSQAPFVGAGIVEFAVLDASGAIVRSPAYTDKTVGIVGLDGSVMVNLSLWGALTGGGSGGGGANIATTAVALTAGDAIVTANHASDVTRVTKATAANMALGFVPNGIALVTIGILGLVVYATPGTTVAASILDLSPTGTTSWAILDANARVVRKTNPTPSDVAVGVINQQGNLLFLPREVPSSQLDIGQPPYSLDNTGAAGVSDGIRQAIIDADIAGGAMQLNFASKEVKVPQGLWLVDKPIHVKTEGCRISGEGRLTSHLRATTYVGPLFHVAPDIGQFPTAVDGGGATCAIIKHEVAVQNEHWFEISECGAGGQYHGMGAISIEMVLTMSATTQASGALLFASFGDRLATDGTDNEAVGVGYAGASGPITQNAFYFTLTTTSGLTSVFATTGSSVIGTKYRVQCVYNGATMKIFIDGVERATGAKTGNIVQGSWESVIFGGQYSYFLGNRKYSTADALLSSFKVSAVAVGASSGLGKLTEDANTACLINFELYDGVFLKARARPTTTSTSCVDAYYIHRFDNVGVVGGMVDIIMTDMCLTNLYGTAINANTGFNIVIRDLTTTSKNGIRLDNNCFKASIANLYMTSTNNDITGNNARVGISMVGAANVMSAGNVYVSGFDSNLVVSGAGDIGTWGSWYSTLAKGHILVISSVNVSWLAESEISDEASVGSKVPDYFLAIIATHLSYWNSFQPSQGGSAGLAPLIVTQGDAVFGGGRHVFDCPWMKADASNTGLISAIGTGTYDVVVRWPFLFGSVPIVRGTPPVGVKFHLDPMGKEAILPITMTDANRTVTVNEWLNFMLVVTGTLTATRTFTVPAAKTGPHVVQNNTAQTLNIFAAGSGVGAACTSGKTMTVLSDGTDLKVLSIV